MLGLPGHESVTLAAAPLTPLAGWLTPVGVTSPDGRYVAYNAWRELRERRPGSLMAATRASRPATRSPGPRSAFTTSRAGPTGSTSTARSPSHGETTAAIAYFKGADRDYRAGVSYVGRRLRPRRRPRVREALDGEARPLRRRRLGGQHVARLSRRGGRVARRARPRRPGKRRVLASNAGLVAVSPDGTRAFIEHGPESGPPRVDLLAVANGGRLASLDLTTVDPSVGVVGYAGDWQGDLVAAASASGLALFRIIGDRIELAQTLRALGQGIAEPRFVGAGRVTGWTSSSSGGAFVDCDRASGRCARTVPMPAARGAEGFPAWRRPVYNPSRPQEGEA